MATAIAPSQRRRPAYADRVAMMDTENGRSMTLHPFSRGCYPGSGTGAQVIAGAGLDGDGQLAAISKYVEARTRAS